MKPAENCLCGAAAPYHACCGRYIDTAKSAPTAEALMRSRYSANVRQNEAYLKESWYPSTCPATILEASPPKWLGLKIIDTDAGQPGEKQGRVEFVARYKIAGKAYRLHEKSDFVFENGQWLYLRGRLEQG